MIRPLSAPELAEALEELAAWELRPERKAIYRRFVFPDFGGAMGFMVQVAIAAEKADHHPEWSNVYNRVDVWLTTHDADGVSQRDIALARHMDALAP